MHYLLSVFQPLTCFDHLVRVRNGILHKYSVIKQCYIMTEAGWRSPCQACNVSKVIQGDQPQKIVDCQKQYLKYVNTATPSTPCRSPPPLMNNMVFKYAWLHIFPRVTVHTQLYMIYIHIYETEPEQNVHLTVFHSSLLRTILRLFYSQSQGSKLFI